MPLLYPLTLSLAADIEPAAKDTHSPPPQAAGQPERFSPICVVAAPNAMAGTVMVCGAASHDVEADAEGAEYGTLVLSALWAVVDPHTLMVHLERWVNYQLS